jgi:hypothetical protein
LSAIGSVTNVALASAAIVSFTTGATRSMKGAARSPHHHPVNASQGRSARTTNCYRRLDEEFKRRIKTQTVLPSAETAAMLFWALVASGQITMRKADGWQTLAQPPALQCIDLAA